MIYGHRCEPSRDFGIRRPFRNLAGLARQIIGQGHAFRRCTRFEFAMQVVWHVAELDHLGHME